MNDERIAALERQIRVMSHMLAARDETIRQLEFDRLVKQVEMEEMGGQLAIVRPTGDDHHPTDEAPEGPPDVVPSGSEASG